MKLEEPTQIMLKATACFIHKIAFTQKPGDLSKLIRIPSWRSTCDLSPNYFPRTTKFQRNTINKGIRLYNSINPEMRKLTPKRFKKEIRKWILYEQPKNPQEPLIKAVRKLNCQSTKPKIVTKKKR